jgi:type III secretory pathway component EscS
MMGNGKKTSEYEKFYVRLNLIFNGIVASTMIPFAIFFLQGLKEEQVPLVEEDLAATLKIVLVVMSLVLLIIANWQGPKLIAKVRTFEGIPLKLSKYLSQKIVHYAMIESSAMVALFGLYLLKDQFFNVIYLGVLFMFSMHRPSFGRVAKEIGEKESVLADWANGKEEN